MKKIKYTRLFSLMLAVVSVAGLLWISACSDDDGGKDGGGDETAPTITVASPSAGTIGVSDAILAVNSTITDNEELASVKVTIGNGDTEVYTETVTTFSNPMSFTYNKNITLPDDAPLGEHTLTILAKDKDGNEKTSTVALTVLPALEEGKTTVLITSVPEVTGDDAFYAVGQFQGWNPAIMDNPVTKYTDSEGADSYYILLPNDAGADQGFKFVRGNDWPFGEKDPDGKEIDNRKFEAGAQFVEVEIAGWRDYNPELVNNSGGTIIVIGGVPQSTTTTIKGYLKKSLTAGNDIESATYSIQKKNGDVFEAVAGQTDVALTLDAEDGIGETHFSQDVTITGSGFGVGEYRIVVKGLDSEGFKVREDKTLQIVEFPCATPTPAVVATKTRFIINHPSTTDDIYITGNWAGVADAFVWGVADPAYKLTKISNTCAYIDIEMPAADKIVQFFRSNVGYTDWWKGQATNTAGSDATAGWNTTGTSNGTNVQLYYAYWREEPAP